MLSGHQKIETDNFVALEAVRTHPSGLLGPFQTTLFPVHGIYGRHGRIEQAIDLFERSSFARPAFGDPVVEHYVHFFRTEAAAYDVSVDNWERKRYFERI